MKIAILDDYFDTLRTLPCFRRLDGHEVTVWHDHTEDIDLLGGPSRSWRRPFVMVMGKAPVHAASPR